VLIGSRACSGAIHEREPTTRPDGLGSPACSSIGPAFGGVVGKWVAHHAAQLRAFAEGTVANCYEVYRTFTRSILPLNGKGALS
jgi:hypothetical protein